MLAIIPARGGSKELPGKNIKQLCGKPLISYTIEAAISAKTIDRIVLSTDDREIARVASKYRIEIPFMRPKKLAEDNSPAIDAYLYTINKINTDLEGNYKEFIVLLPTSPLRDGEDIDKAVGLFYEKNADSVISCVEMQHPPYWAKKIDGQGKIKSYFSGDDGNRNRQDFETAYIPNGALFIFKCTLLEETGNYYSDMTYAYIMPKERSVDIDSLSDFYYAEYLMGNIWKK